MVVFRVDSNSMIGKSHMYRCLAIAKAMKLMGKEVLFVCREDSDVSDIQKSFLDYRLVPSMRLGSDEAINILKDIINEVHAGVCVVDSYDIDNGGLKRIREACKVIYVDDYCYEIMDVDCVINTNVFVENLDYRLKYPSNVELLLGMDYAPFSMDYVVGNSKKDKSYINTVLVYTGELDRYELAPGIVDTLLDCMDDNVRIKVLTNKNSVTKDRLFQMSNYSPQLIIEQDVQNFSKLLGQCDAAVFCAEPVCYDLLRFGIPSCVYVNDNNQKMFYNSMVEKNLAVAGGNCVDSKNKFYYNLREGILKLTDGECRKSLIENISKLNIGSGAEKVAKAILKYE